ncbi:hypothetical protein M9H77_21147 [Catharanthus roseus]|uniref:Uncharacterized protein n=1 Tax=Catharanthus roseus TaxID=4058 RepID=A0ACC0ALX8_CATRO|nr:hypothetical protein M9H77_21147 [Catharanthus roseus]
MHFRVETTNRAESEHSVLKLWLSTCHSDLDTVFLNIDSLIEGQVANIKASLEFSRTKQKFNMKSNLILRILDDIKAIRKTQEIGGCHLSARQQDMDSEMRSLTDLLQQIRSGSGSGSGSRERWRPPQAPRGRGRGRARGRRSLSSVIDPSLCSTFPYTNAFLAFIYPFISNWQDVIDDENCGYRVVADFVFRDEHQWPEVCRRMLYELKHATNIYLSLLGSAECVYELVHRTQWQDGPAPLEHWFETSYSLYVIANAFNMCVVLIGQLGFTSVLSLYSYSDRLGGTLVIGLLTEQQHFIQLQMHDECPIPPLHVQWIHHRSKPVNNWVDSYYERM